MSQKTARAMDAIFSEAGHGEAWTTGRFLLHLPTNQRRDRNKQGVKSRQETAWSVNLAMQEAQAEGSHFNACLSSDGKISLSSLVRTCLKLKSKTPNPKLNLPTRNSGIDGEAETKGLTNQ